MRIFRFGYNIFKKNKNFSFINISVRIARILIVNNLKTKSFGPVVKLFFNENNIDLPQNIEQLKDLETNSPDTMKKIYCEISIRLVRGIDNIAHALSYCLHYDACNGYIFSNNSNKTGYIKNYVYEILRLFPPIAKASRTTKKNFSENKCQLTFNIQKYNRSLSNKINIDNPPSAIASFGSYTTTPCPAMKFSTSIIEHFIKMIWNYYKWHPESLDPRIMHDNKRLSIIGYFELKEN